jgi:hypothetical protein
MKSEIQNMLAISGDADLVFRNKSRLVEFLSRGASADLLVNLALKEGMAGILYKNFLKSEIFEFIDTRLQEKIQSQYYRTIYINLKLNHALKEILSPLDQNEVEVVLLQGIDLLQGTYDDIGLRPLSDIDLWVLETNYRKLIPILTSIGYRPDPLYPNTFRKGPTVLDIHTHILWADRIQARQYLLSKDQNYIYQKTRLLEIDGLKARCLDRYDRIIYLSLHLLKHNAERLIWLVDIKVLVSDWKALDWEELLDSARELGQEKCVAYICFLLNLLFEFDRPEQLCPKLKQIKLNALEKKLLTLRQKKESLPEWSTLILFSTGKGFFKGVSFILETLFPRPEILRQVFSDHSGLSIPQLYAKRTWQLFSMFFTSLKAR